MLYLLMGSKSDAIKTNFDIVARFTSQKKANDYLTKAKLKKPIRRMYVPDVRYKKKSLLKDYAQAFVKQHQEPKDSPKNPIL